MKRLSTSIAFMVIEVICRFFIMFSILFVLDMSGVAPLGGTLHYFLLAIYFIWVAMGFFLKYYNKEDRK